VCHRRGGSARSRSLHHHDVPSAESRPHSRDVDHAAACSGRGIGQDAGGEDSDFGPAGIWAVIRVVVGENAERAEGRGEIGWLRSGSEGTGGDRVACQRTTCGQAARKPARTPQEGRRPSRTQPWVERRVREERHPRSRRRKHPVLVSGGTATRCQRRRESGRERDFLHSVGVRMQSRGCVMGSPFRGCRLQTCSTRG